MKSKVLVVAAALVLGGVSIACAQSQPNFGPNAPSRGDSYGKPPSGTLPPPSGARAYRYRSYSYAMFRPHHRWWWYRHHRHHRHY